MSIPEPGAVCHCPTCDHVDPTCDLCGTVLEYDEDADEDFCPRCEAPA